MGKQYQDSRNQNSQFQETHSNLLRDRTAFQPLNALVGLIVGPGLIIGALFYFGQPGLRISYTWNGNAGNPIYGTCHYMTVSGWETRHYECPLVDLFPVRIAT